MDEYNSKIGKVSPTTLNYILIVLILVGVSVFSFMNGPTTNDIRIEEEQFIITGYDQTVLPIAYDDITRLEYLDSLPDFGEAVNVAENGKTLSGTYQNEAYGEYQVHVDTSIDACMLIQTETVTVLFNIESADTTKELCKAFDKYIQGIF